MNKTQKILAAIGGVIVFAALAAGVFAWMSRSAKIARIEGDPESDIKGLSAVINEENGILSNKLAPCEANRNSLKTSSSRLNAWRESALVAASVGGRNAIDGSKDKFTEIVDIDSDVIKSWVPDGTTNSFVAAAYDFSAFKPSGVKEESLDDLKAKWDDAKMILKTLCDSGAVSLENISVKAAVDSMKNEKEANKPRNSRNRNAKTVVAAKPSRAFTYVVTYRTRPPAFVRALETFATTTNRFVVVDAFTITRNDTITAACDQTAVIEKKKKEAEEAERKRRQEERQRMRESKRKGVDFVAQTVEEPASHDEFTPVTDPATEDPVTVTMTVSVHDFSSVEEPAKKGTNK